MVVIIEAVSAKRKEGTFVRSESDPSVARGPVTEFQTEKYKYKHVQRAVEWRAAVDARSTMLRTNNPRIVVGGWLAGHVSSVSPVPSDGRNYFPGCRLTSNITRC